MMKRNERRNGKRTVMAYANSKGLGEPAHCRSFTRTYAVRCSFAKAVGERKSSSNELETWLRKEAGHAQ